MTHRLNCSFFFQLWFYRFMTAHFDFRCRWIYFHDDITFPQFWEILWSPNHKSVRDKYFNMWDSFIIKSIKSIWSFVHTFFFLINIYDNIFQNLKTYCNIFHNFFLIAGDYLIIASLPFSHTRVRYFYVYLVNHTCHDTWNFTVYMHAWL